MRFELTDEQKMVRDMARDFAIREVEPKARELDKEGRWPVELVKRMGELGLMGVAVGDEHGGAGADTVSYALAMEEISRACASTGVIMSVNNSLFAHGLVKYGTEAQKHKYLKPVASGQKIGAYSLTEPMSGSDAGTMKSRATLSADGACYIINGRKSWVTSAPYADFIILFTMTQPEKKHRGVTAFIIETDQPGFIRGKKEPKLGIRASATSEIIFDNYECPVENRLGAEGEGFKIAMTVLDAGRIGIASQALGIAEAAFEASVAYAKEREAFGQKIGEFQQIQAKLADMKCRVDASRLLIYQAALAKMAAKKGDGRYSLEASEAKLFASETAMWVTTQAIQIHGGMGYSKEMPLERYFRDAKITEIYEGTSEIQRMVIARALTGLR